MLTTCPFTWIALWLTCFGACRPETHAVDHVVETAFQQLEQVLASRPLQTRRSLVVVAELTLEHTIDEAQLLLLA